MKNYPQARKENIMETIHGVEVADPYRWMENEKDPEVAAWVEKQNRLTDMWLADTDLNSIAASLRASHDVENVSTPARHGDLYVWFERHPGQKHHVLYKSSAPYSADKQVVFDVNQLSDDGAISLPWYKHSRTGKYALFALQEKGAERNRIIIRNNNAGSEQEFYFGRSFNFSWADDESGFYYTRSDFKNHGGETSDETHYQQSYFHRMGESRENDTLLFEATSVASKEAGILIHGSEDNHWICVNMAIGWSKRRIFLGRFGDPLTEILDDIDAMKAARIIEGYVYVTTNHAAPNYRVLRAPIGHHDIPLDQWEEIIPEDGNRKLEDWYINQRHIIVEYTKIISSELEVLDRDGRHVLSLPVPPLAGIAGLWTNKYVDEVYFSVQTFLSASRIFGVTGAGQVRQLWQDERSLDDAAFEARQVWYESKDGTRVPMSIISRQDIVADSSSPTIMYGYGGFAHGRYPGFMGIYEPWLRAGGVLALPNIRGGDEFGEAWHKGGMLANKQNCFDDFIAAAEFLISEKITSPDKLAIIGGSNGGLLTGACMVQRPDLFAAVVSDVPLLDMIRFPKYLLAYRWIHEYGDPAKADEFAWLYAYSPYHHIDPQKRYPAVLFCTALNDTRVHPMHAWKMAAAMQALNPANPVLLRTRGDAGHGPGKTFYGALNDKAEQLAFIGKVVGLAMNGGENV